MERESMEFDVLVVGGGPAGLAAAIRLKQCAEEKGMELNVCVIEKGAEIGAHILAGSVLDPISLRELLPDFEERSCPLSAPVVEDRVVFLSATKSFTTPNFALPNCFHNHGNYVVRLGHFTKWLGEQAEAAGVEIYPGFAGSEILYDENGAVKGVATGDMGLNRDGTPGPNHQPGMELHAKYTFFAEGCRGQLGRELMEHFNLRRDCDPQVYGIGVKELWEVPEGHPEHKPGLAIHTAGWPLDVNTYGGSSMYHFKENLVSVGFVVGLNYQNPYISPFEELQRYKTHPYIRRFLEGGKRIAYGARAISAGSIQSLPKTIFPGGVLIGDNAGFLNAARLKGTHTCMKSGMLAAEAAFQAIVDGRSRDELTAFPEAFRASWAYNELYKTRNFKPYLKKGLILGSLLFGVDQKLFSGRLPWTWRNTADHEALQPASQHKPIDYPKPDGVLTFDRLSSVFLSNTNHEENQPCHLKLKDPAVALKINLEQYDSPEQRYCPAGVYEIVRAEGAEPRLQINAQNCLHCKTCDIKDPTQNIVWTAPQGGEGPLYQGM